MHESLAICTVAIIVITGLWSYRGFKDDRWVAKYIFSPVEVLRDKEYYRLISSGFLHANWVHLLFNMFSFYSFGSYIERVFGIQTLLLIYFASILGGSVVSLYLHRHHEYRALGASGGVCGIIYAAIFLLPGGAVRLFLLPIPIPSWLFAILFILVSYFGMRSQVGNIGHDAHLGGAIIGLATATVLYPRIVTDSPVLFTFVVGIAIVLVWFTYKHPLYMPLSSPFKRAFWRKWSGNLKRSRDSIKQTFDERKMDRLHAKISRSGYDSLTTGEKKQLEAISRKRRIAARKKKIDRGES